MKKQSVEMRGEYAPPEFILVSMCHGDILCQSQNGISVQSLKDDGDEEL